ncbi:RlpA-like double-psi beta-barrel-protein domain-containing protein-containing protein [Xylaria nigripes]|nr:RlpA-like double-psi beta-barrel-protein domain-containing protein-containing protein [Xylaria nigripes]
MQFINNIVLAVAAVAGVVSAAPAGNKLEARSQTGDLTYYATGLGACGVTNSESDSIVAISKDLFDQYTPNGNPNLNSLCGRQIQINLNGKSAIVTVEDRCVGCAMNDLDVPVAVFSELADPALGRVSMTWDWVN